MYRGCVVVTALIGVSAAVSFGAFSYHPNPARQYLSVALGLLLGVVLLGWTLGVIDEWFSRRRPIPLAGFVVAVSGLGGFLIAPDVGVALSDYRFRADLRAYEQVVAMLRTQPPRSLPLDSLPPTLRRRVYLVRSWRRPDGEFGVDFFYGFGFPPQHSAYVYYDGKAARPPGDFWHSGRKLAPRWWSVTG